MASIDLTIPVCIEYEGVEDDGSDDIIEEEVEFDFEVDYDAGEPANFAGHPDRWHPGDPGYCDVLSARIWVFGRWYEVDLAEVFQHISEENVVEAVNEYVANQWQEPDYDYDDDPGDYYDRY